MKGFNPPPRYGGAMVSHEPLPITKTITVTEGISVKDLAEKPPIRTWDTLIATCRFLADVRDMSDRVANAAQSAESALGRASLALAKALGR